MVNGIYKHHSFIHPSILFVVTFMIQQGRIQDFATGGGALGGLLWGQVHGRGEGWARSTSPGPATVT